MLQSEQHAQLLSLLWNVASSFHWISQIFGLFRIGKCCFVADLQFQGTQESLMIWKSLYLVEKLLSLNEFEFKHRNIMLVNVMMCNVSNHLFF